MALACSKSLRYDVSLYNGIYNVKEEGVILVQISKETLDCSCKHFVTMGIPCDHLMALSNRYENISLITKIRERWLVKKTLNKIFSTPLKNLSKIFLLSSPKVKLFPILLIDL